MTAADIDTAVAALQNSLAELRPYVESECPELII